MAWDVRWQVIIGSEGAHAVGESESIFQGDTVRFTLRLSGADAAIISNLRSWESIPQLAVTGHQSDGSPVRIAVRSLPTNLLQFEYRFRYEGEKRLRFFGKSRLATSGRTAAVSARQRMFEDLELAREINVIGQRLGSEVASTAGSASRMHERGERERVDRRRHYREVERAEAGRAESERSEQLLAQVRGLESRIEETRESASIRRVRPIDIDEALMRLPGALAESQEGIEGELRTLSSPYQRHGLGGLVGFLQGILEGLVERIFALMQLPASALAYMAEHGIAQTYVNLVNGLVRLLQNPEQIIIGIFIFGYELVGGPLERIFGNRWAGGDQEGELLQSWNDFNEGRNVDGGRHISRAIWELFDLVTLLQGIRRGVSRLGRVGVETEEALRRLTPYLERARRASQTLQRWLIGIPDQLQGIADDAARIWDDLLGHPSYAAEGPLMEASRGSRGAGISMSERLGGSSPESTPRSGGSRTRGSASSEPQTAESAQLRQGMSGTGLPQLAAGALGALRSRIISAVEMSQFREAVRRRRMRSGRAAERRILREHELHPPHRRYPGGSVPEATFREWAIDYISEDPNNPFWFLLDLEEGNFRSAIPTLLEESEVADAAGRRATSDAARRGRGELPRGASLDDHSRSMQVQMGHTLSAHAGGRRLALEWSYLNLSDSQIERLGVIIQRGVLDIAGIPVEARTAIVMELEGYLTAGTVERARAHPGWLLDEWTVRRADAPGELVWERR